MVEYKEWIVLGEWPRPNAKGHSDYQKYTTQKNLINKVWPMKTETLLLAAFNQSKDLFHVWTANNGPLKLVGNTGIPYR